MSESLSESLSLSDASSSSFCCRSCSSLSLSSFFFGAERLEPPPRPEVGFSAELLLDEGSPRLDLAFGAVVGDLFLLDALGPCRFEPFLYWGSDLFPPH